LYEIIDNFLSEKEFRIVQEFAADQPCNDDTSSWTESLLFDSGVAIKGPEIERGIDKDFRLLNFKSKLENVFELKFNKKNSDYSIKQIIEYGSNIQRYKYGTGILLHKDHSKKINQKRYTISLYLNNEWKPNWGGELIIYKTKKNEYFIERDSCEPIDVILPKRNRLVIIGDSWHKVSPNLNKSVDRLIIQTFITLSLKKNNNKHSETI